jgi:hypothetical protein
VDAVAGDDLNAGTQGAPFKTISHALTVALPGDVVKVAPGRYDVVNGETFPIVLPAALELRGDEANKGAGPSETLIAGGGLAPAPNPGDVLWATVVPRAGSVLAGFRVQNDAPPDPMVLVFGVVLPEDDVEVRDCTVEGSVDGGLRFYNGSANQVVRGNVIQNHSAQAAAGISFAGGGAGSVLEDNFVTLNAFGVEYLSVGGDLGGGGAGSTGGNTLICNLRADLRTTVIVTVTAASNLWDHAPPTSSTTVDVGGIDLANGGGFATIDTTGATVAPGNCP